jgi:hypothetical protein
VHLMRKLLGIIFLSVRSKKLSFFFSMTLVAVRLISLRSLMCCVKASCCDEMRGRSGSNSEFRIMESFGGF